MAHRRTLALGLAGALIAGCGGVQLKRTPNPAPSAGTPKIERIIDLGALPLAESGSLDKSHSDGKLSPGEWCGVVGRGLGADATVTLAGRALPVEGYLKGGGLLVRVPRGLSPRVAHTLQVTTPGGQAERRVMVHGTLVAAGTHGGEVVFIDITPKAPDALSGQRTVVELDDEVEAVVISPSGALLYAVPAPTTWLDPDTGQTVQRAKAVIFHLGAKDHPRRHGSINLDLPAAASALFMPAEHLLAAVCGHRLVVLDVSKPGTADRVAVLDLPTNQGRPTAYTEVEMLAGGRRTALLEIHGNRVVFVDLAHPTAPRLVGSLGLAGSVNIPLSIDLARVPGDPDGLWVLMGLNWRVATAKLKNKTKKLKGKLKRKIANVMLGSKEHREAEGGTVKVSDVIDKLPSDMIVTTHSRLVRVKLDPDGPKVIGQRVLPDKFFPFFALAQPGGQVLVSGVGGQVWDLHGIKLSSGGVAKAVELLHDMGSLGRIVRVADGQEPSTMLSGVALYFQMLQIPDGPLVWSTLRPGVEVLPPDIAVDWGVEGEHNAWAQIKRLGWKAILPPYALSVLALR